MPEHVQVHPSGGNTGGSGQGSEAACCGVAVHAPSGSVAEDPAVLATVHGAVDSPTSHIGGHGKSEHPVDGVR
jgi:hypothetical protein